MEVHGKNSLPRTANLFSRKKESRQLEKSSVVFSPKVKERTLQIYRGCLRTAGKKKNPHRALRVSIRKFVCGDSQE